MAHTGGTMDPMIEKSNKHIWRMSVAGVLLCAVCGAAFELQRCRTDACRETCSNITTAARGIGTMITGATGPTGPAVTTTILAAGTATGPTGPIDGGYYGPA
jgi:hypothetical protein